jgi:filamentous hemagglutinin family protein
VKRKRKQARQNGSTAAAGALLISALQLNSGKGVAATLPTPCLQGTCGSFVTQGSAGAVNSGSTLTVNQTTSQAILNWQNFNVSAGASVVFNQIKGPTSIALNRIHDANPSTILGNISAGGQIYLINQNGIIFGSTARINTAGLLASTLNISDATFANGILTALSSGASTGQQYALSRDGAPAAISIESGAKITTNAAGQRILMAANSISNADKSFLQQATSSMCRQVRTRNCAACWSPSTGAVP